MDCTEFSNLLDSLLDRSVTDAEKSEMLRHREQCAECQKKWQIMQGLLALDRETEPPEAFSSAWREKIREEDHMEQKLQKKKSRRGMLAAAAALVFVLGGTALTRGSLPAARQYEAPGTVVTDLAYGLYEEGSSNRANPMGEPLRSMMSMENDAVYESASAPDTDAVRAAKIIRSARFTLKTTDFEASLTSLQELAVSFGGRIETLNRRGDTAGGEMRSASLTLRVPSERLDDFLSGTGALGNVTDFSQEAQDVSDTYYDLKNRLITQQEKMERLRALMNGAADVSDLIEIESAIADTQYLIDTYTAQMNGFDSRANDSTVNVTIREVRKTEVKEVTLGERIGQSLRDSLQNGWVFLEDTTVFLAAALPWIAGLSILILGIIGIRRMKKKTKKSEE